MNDSLNVMYGLWYGKNNEGIIPSGATSVINMKGAPIPCTVTVSPQAGDTLTMSFSTNGGITYQAFSAGASGAITSETAVIFDFAITHIKSACSGGGTTSQVTIC